MVAGRVLAIDAARAQSLPQHELIVRDQGVHRIAKPWWPRGVVEILIEHTFRRFDEVRVLHEKLADQSALIADGGPAVEGRLLQQLRIADSSAGHDDSLGGRDAEGVPLVGWMMEVVDRTDGRP